MRENLLLEKDLTLFKGIDMVQYDAEGIKWAEQLVKFLLEQLIKV